MVSIKDIINSGTQIFGDFIDGFTQDASHRDRQRHISPDIQIVEMPLALRGAIDPKGASAKSKETLILPQDPDPKPQSTRRGQPGQSAYKTGSKRPGDPGWDSLEQSRATSSKQASTAPSFLNSSTCKLPAFTRLPGNSALGRAQGQPPAQKATARTGKIPTGAVNKSKTIPRTLQPPRDPPNTISLDDYDPVENADEEPQSAVSKLTDQLYAQRRPSFQVVPPTIHAASTAMSRHTSGSKSSSGLPVSTKPSKPIIPIDISSSNAKASTSQQVYEVHDHDSSVDEIAIGAKKPSFKLVKQMKPSKVTTEVPSNVFHNAPNGKGKAKDSSYSSTSTILDIPIMAFETVYALYEDEVNMSMIYNRAGDPTFIFKAGPGDDIRIACRDCSQISAYRGHEVELPSGFAFDLKESTGSRRFLEQHTGISIDHVVVVVKDTANRDVDTLFNLLRDQQARIFKQVGQSEIIHRRQFLSNTRGNIQAGAKLPPSALPQKQPVFNAQRGELIKPSDPDPSSDQPIATTKPARAKARPSAAAQKASLAKAKKAKSNEPITLDDTDEEEDHSIEHVAAPQPAPSNRRKSGRLAGEQAEAEPAADEVVLVFPFESAGTSNSVSVRQGDIKRLLPEEFLNDTLIEFGLKKIAEDLPSDLKDYTQFFNSFFYGKLTNKKKASGPHPYKSVEKWTNKYNLFSKKFVIIPICEKVHWFLAIIMNPGAILRPSKRRISSSPEKVKTRQSDAVKDEDKDETKSKYFANAEEAKSEPTSQSQTDAEEELAEDELDASKLFDDANVTVNDAQTSPTKPHAEELPDPTGDRIITTPGLKTEGMTVREVREKFGGSTADPCYIFMFDSLGTNHPGVARKLADYLQREAEAKLGLTLEETSSTDIIAKKAKVPLQPNSCDCGLYLLHYARQFLSDPARAVETLLTRVQNKKSETHTFDELWQAEEVRNQRKKMRDEVKQLSDDYKIFAAKQKAQKLAEKEAKRLATGVSGTATPRAMSPTVPTPSEGASSPADSAPTPVDQFATTKQEDHPPLPSLAPFAPPVQDAAPKSLPSFEDHLIQVYDSAAIQVETPSTVDDVMEVDEAVEIVKQMHEILDAQSSLDGVRETTQGVSAMEIDSANELEVEIIKQPSTSRISSPAASDKSVKGTSSPATKRAPSPFKTKRAKRTLIDDSGHNEEPRKKVDFPIKSDFGYFQTTTGKPKAPPTPTLIPKPSPSLAAISHYGASSDDEIEDSQPPKPRKQSPAKVPASPFDTRPPPALTRTPTKLRKPFERGDSTPNFLQRGTHTVFDENGSKQIRRSASPEKLIDMSASPQEYRASGNKRRKTSHSYEIL